MAPHPAELIRVDPDQVTHEIPYDQKSKLIPYPFATVGLLRYTSYILHGDWDRTVQPLSDPNIEYRKLLHESFDLRYGRGMSWETTPLYERRDDLLEDPQSAFDRWDALYERLQQEGYRPQAELPSKDRLAISPWSDEVAIAITRDGDLLRVTQGNHRIRIAQHAGIDEMCVRVAVRHEEWQQKRVRAYKRPEGGDAPQSGKTDTHPDLPGRKRRRDEKQ